MALLDSTKFNFSWKKLNGRRHTTSLKEWYEEFPGVLANINKTNVWTDEVPAVVPASDTDVVKVYPALQLTEDTSVAGRKSFLAYSVAGDVNSVALGNFIRPSFGQGYSVRVYAGGTADANELPTSHSSNWTFDYENGNLWFENTPPVGNIYIKVYQYVGATLSDFVSSGGSMSGATFSGDVVIEGNLSVVGSATQVNIESEVLKVADNIITLNSNFTAGTPTENAGVEVLRGDSQTVYPILWDEATDKTVTSVWNSTTSSFDLERILTETDATNLATSINNVSSTLSSEIAAQVGNISTDLASTTDEAKGSALVGYFGQAGATFSITAGTVYAALDSIVDKINSMDAVSAALQTSIDNEVTRATNAETALQSAINQEIIDRQTAIDTAIAGLTAGINSNVYTFVSSTPQSTYTITHNLGSDLVEVQVWVYDAASMKFRNDIVAVTVENENAITIELSIVENIKVVVRNPLV